MKIAILGFSGSGKSTLAKILSERYQCPPLYLDTVNFVENWQERGLAEGQEIVRKFMEQESWVIDGNYSKFYLDRRLEEADQVIYMNFPRHICLYHAFKRYFTYRGKSRESMAEGCHEKLDFSFIKWILYEGRTRKVRERRQRITEQYGQKLVVLKNPGQVEAFLKQTRSEKAAAE